MSVLTVLVGGALALVIAIVVTMLAIVRTPRAGEILVVTGGSNGPVAHHSRVFVLPLLRRAQALQIGVQKTEISSPDTMTSQGVPLKVDAVVAFKIDTDPSLIGNAIERFSENPGQMTDFVHTVFAGHLRAIIGGMTAEEATTGRDALARNVREASLGEMANMGLKIDSVQIRDVEDAPGSQFLEAWRQKEQARMIAEARIAEAAANRLATEKEMEAESANAAARSASEIQQARAQAEADKARATAAQAGPLTEALARQEVIAANTRATELEAELQEKMLQVKVIKPAEAERDASVARADGEAQSTVLAAQGNKQRVELDAAANKVQVELAAQADAARVRLAAEAEAARVEATGLAEAKRTSSIGLAEAEATRARGLAEAEAIEARANALEKNSDAVMAQLAIEKLPEIVAAASAPIGSIGNLQVMDISTVQGIAGGNIAAALGVLPELMKAVGGFASNATKLTSDEVAPGVVGTP